MLKGLFLRRPEKPIPIEPDTPEIFDTSNKQVVSIRPEDKSGAVKLINNIPPLRNLDLTVKDSHDETMFGTERGANFIKNIQNSTVLNSNKGSE